MKPGRCLDAPTLSPAVLWAAREMVLAQELFSVVGKNGAGLVTLTGNQLSPWGFVCERHVLPEQQPGTGGWGVGSSHVLGSCGRVLGMTSPLRCCCFSGNASVGAISDYRVLTSHQQLPCPLMGHCTLLPCSFSWKGELVTEIS